MVDMAPCTQIPSPLSLRTRRLTACAGLAAGWLGWLGRLGGRPAGWLLVLLGWLLAAAAGWLAQRSTFNEARDKPANVSDI